MGLIARHLESLGWPTTSLSSSWSITASANPPRAAFVNYPLGHTAGRPHELEEQKSIVRAALCLLRDAAGPGEIRPLPYEWPTEWRTKARALSDKRTPRFDTPQYQFRADEVAAHESAGRR